MRVPFARIAEITGCDSLDLFNLLLQSFRTSDLPCRFFFAVGRRWHRIYDIDYAMLHMEVAKEYPSRLTRQLGRPGFAHLL